MSGKRAQKNKNAKTMTNYFVIINDIVALAVVIYFSLHVCIQYVQASMCPGCVELDELSFNKTIKRFPHALVKFDTAFPYGEKHEIYAELSKAVHTVTDDLLIATVGIKDYGNYENMELGKRYNIDNEKYPTVILFRDFNVENYIELPNTTDITLDNLKQFITSNTNIYIGRDGCLQQFNELVKNFTILEEVEQGERLLQAAKLIETLTDANEIKHAHIYEIYMKKIRQSKVKDYVQQEIQRLQRLKSSKITDSKKSELIKRINILEAFLNNPYDKKDEL